MTLSMDLSFLDFQSGKCLRNHFRLSPGFLVSLDSDPPSNGFLLLVSFSRKRFRLTNDSVATYLQSNLGGIAKDFAAVLVDQQIFRFTVSCKQVGFLVPGLNSFVSEHFKMALSSFAMTRVFKGLRTSPNRTLASCAPGMKYAQEIIGPRSLMH